MSAENGLICIIRKDVTKIFMQFCYMDKPFIENECKLLVTFENILYEDGTVNIDAMISIAYDFECIYNVFETVEYGMKTRISNNLIKKQKIEDELCV